jgi:WD40 repeat protein
MLLSILGVPVDSSYRDGHQPPPLAKPPGTDWFGDPLPERVFYRIGTVRLQHEHVQALIFSADGSHLLSQGMPSELRVWDIATGRAIRQMAVPEDLNRCGPVIASPDDRYLACVADADSPALLDKATGKVIARWKHHVASCSLAFSRDSKELIGLTRAQTVFKWNVADRKETARLRLDMTNVDEKNYSDYWHLSPDGALAAFLPPSPKGEPDMPWHFWSTATGKQCRAPVRSRSWPSQVSWSPDGRLLAVVTWDNTLDVWDTVEGKRLALPPAHLPQKGSAGKLAAQCAAFHPAGKLLAVGNNDHVALWNLRAGMQVWKKARAAGILAFSPDGKTLAIAGVGAITLVDAASGEPIKFSRQAPGWVSLTGWHPFLRHGRSFIVSDQAGLSEIDVATGKRLRSFYPGKRGGFYYGGLWGDDRLFYCVGNDEHGAAHVFMFDAATGKEIWRRPKQPIEISFAADGKTLAVLSWNREVFTLLDAATGRDIKKLSAPSYKNEASTYKAVSDDVRRAATTQGWRTVDLWDLATGKKARSLECPPGWGHGTLYFTPGNKLLIGAAYRPFIHRYDRIDWTRVWDVGTGRIVRRFGEPILAISADRRWAALEADKGVLIRHLRSGQFVATIPDRSPLGFSPDGSLLAVHGADWHEVGLWDTLTGRRVCRWVDPLSEFHNAAFSPDGRTLLLTVRSGASLLVCDVTGMASHPSHIPLEEITPAEADRQWTKLSSDAGPRSQRAYWRLVAGGDGTVKMLRGRLRGVEPPDATRLAALIAALDSERFKEREKAFRALGQIELARPALENALQGKPSLETQRRIELILAKLDASSWGVEALQALRGVRLLEQIGSSSARQLLESLARGAAGAVLTEEAQAALERLAARTEHR